MKKIVVISIIFFILLAVAIWEISFSTEFFHDLNQNLTVLQQSIYENDKKIDNPQTIKLMDEIRNDWDKNKEILFCFGNHNTFRSLDEKIVSLDAMVKTNYHDDAKIMVEVIIGQVKAVSNETMPVPSNLF